MMTAEEQSLCLDLAIRTNGVRKVSKEEFLRRFPSAVEDGKLALHLLEESYRAQDARNLSCALMVGFIFGFGREHLDILCRLVDEDWHINHEDVVDVLDKLRRPETVDALFRATQWVPEYLKFDDNRALAVKAIWALWKLQTPEANARLEQLAASDEPILQETATMLLNKKH
jgi:hypothetical protein